MNILLDTNIVLDVLLNRTEFCPESTEILALSSRSDVKLYITATSITDIYYIANKNIKNKTYIITMIKELLKIVNISGVSEKEVIFALDVNWPDFEDAIQYAIAKIQNMDVIITRNLKDYTKSDIPVYTPKEFLKK